MPLNQSWFLCVILDAESFPKYCSHTYLFYLFLLCCLLFVEKIAEVETSMLDTVMCFTVENVNLKD